MEKVLIDTDCIIDFLRGHKERVRKVFVKIENKEIEALISVISIVELYAGEDSKDKKKESALNLLLSFFKAVPLDQDLGKLAGKIKRGYQISLADAVIGATSLQEKAKLLTFNTKHFRKIPDLVFY